MSDNPYTSESDAHNAPQPTSVLRTCLFTLGALFVVGLLVALLLPIRRSAREPARRNACSNNLKQIALGLQNYEDVYHALPPAHTVDADGKPLHSWRTLILPFIEERRLYETIDLTKPWDDPVNAAACQNEPPCYRCPSDPNPSPNHTTYLACVAADGCFRLTQPRHLSEITDGLSKTFMVIEAPLDRSVPWMSPNDADEALLMSIGPNSKLAHTGGMNAARCDGGVHFISADTSAADWHALISIAGHDKLSTDFSSEP